MTKENERLRDAVASMTKRFEAIENRLSALERSSPQAAAPAKEETTAAEVRSGFCRRYYVVIGWTFITDDYILCSALIWTRSISEGDLSVVAAKFLTLFFDVGCCYYLLHFRNPILTWYHASAVTDFTRCLQSLSAKPWFYKHCCFYFYFFRKSWACCWESQVFMFFLWFVHFALTCYNRILLFVAHRACSTTCAVDEMEIFARCVVAHRLGLQRPSILNQTPSH